MPDGDRYLGLACPNCRALGIFYDPASNLMHCDKCDADDAKIRDRFESIMRKASLAEEHSLWKLGEIEFNQAVRDLEQPQEGHQHIHTLAAGAALTPLPFMRCIGCQTLFAMASNDSPKWIGMNRRGRGARFEIREPITTKDHRSTIYTTRVVASCQFESDRDTIVALAAAIRDAASSPPA